jgi:uncharacterized protein YlaI
VEKPIKCCICEVTLDKNTVELNKKFHGRKITKYFCMNCLSTHLDISVEDLLAKIEDFKNQGCTLFE